MSESRYVSDLLLLSEQYYKQVKLATLAGLIALASDLLDTIFLNWLVAIKLHTTLGHAIPHNAIPHHATPQCLYLHTTPYTCTCIIQHHTIQHHTTLCTTHHTCTPRHAIPHYAKPYHANQQLTNLQLQCAVRLYCHFINCFWSS